MAHPDVNGLLHVPSRLFLLFLVSGFHISHLEANLLDSKGIDLTAFKYILDSLRTVIMKPGCFLKKGNAFHTNSELLTLHHCSSQAKHMTSQEYHNSSYL